MGRLNIILIAGTAVMTVLAACTEPVPPTNSPTSDVAPSIDVTPTHIATTMPPSPTPTLTLTSTSSPTASATAAPLEGQAVSLETINMIDQMQGWATGYGPQFGGHLLRTLDGGLTWYDVALPFTISNGQQQAKQVGAHYFLDATHAVAVGLPEHRLWITQDGGQSWVEGGECAECWGGREVPGYFSFSDPDHGRAIYLAGPAAGSEPAAFYRTEDGGQSWTMLWGYNTEDDILQSEYKTGMAFADAQTGWITLMDHVHEDDYHPTVAITGDGGASWTIHELPIPPEAPDFQNCRMVGTTSPHLFAPQSGIVVGWCELESGGVEIEAGPRRFLYRTTDGGQSWITIPFSLDGALYFISSTTGWVLGENIYRTADGGSTWDDLGTAPSDIVEVDFVDDRIGWVVVQTANDERELLHTVDGGRTWTSTHTRLTLEPLPAETTQEPD